MTATVELSIRLKRRSTLLEGGCWAWHGVRDGQGYGRINIQGVKRVASRVSYETFVGPVPDGLVVDHFLYPERCIGPACINPAHLRPVTPRENTLRGKSFSAVNASKSTCPKGHEYAGVRPGRGSRYCAECHRESGRRTAARFRQLGREVSEQRFAAKQAVGETHCIHGHRYDEQNTGMRAGGGRVCRTCAREANQRYLDRVAARYVARRTR